MTLDMLKNIDTHGEDDEAVIDAIVENKLALKALLGGLSYRGGDWQPRDPDVGIMGAGYGELEIDEKESDPWCLKIWNALPEKFREETEQEILSRLSEDKEEADSEFFSLPEFWD